MKLFIPSFSLLFCICATAQPRFTDSTFGTNGKVVKNTSAPYKYITDMALQTDGKSVVLAEAEYNEVSRIVLLRYNTSGMLDNTFSGNGIADSLIAADVDFYPKAVKLQPDGKILVCGSINDLPNSAFVIRYLSNGSLDNSFGTAGIFYMPQVTFGSTTTSIPTVNNLAIVTGGKLMLLSSYYGADEDLILTRLAPNGTIDSTWGTNGIVALDASASYDPEYSKIEVQTDGKLLIGGNPNEYNQVTSTALNVVVLRLNANGSTDNSYGTAGRIAMHVGTADYDYLKDMALQPNGRVLISGIGNDFIGNYSYAFVVRLLNNGILDNGFGSLGISYIAPAISSTFYSTEGQMSLQTDGKILLAGCSGGPTGNYNMAIACLTASGVPDAGFDGDGFATLSVNGYDNYAIAAQQQTDGKVVLSGLARSGNAASTTIARLTNTGQPDATLNATTAIAYIGSGTDEEAGIGIEILPDGKILNLNGRYTGAGYDVSISRYTANGTPDNSYGTNGSSLVEIPSGYNNFFSGQLSNGKLMMGTSYGDYFVGGGILLTRINAIGTVDSSYGTNGKVFIRTRKGSFVNIVPQIAFQPDGKAVLLYAQQLNNNNDPDSNFVARLNADGTHDNSFNGTGKKFLPDSAYSLFTRLCVQPDGKILVTELRNNFTAGTYTTIRRVTTSGGTDNTFNNGNIATVMLNAGCITLLADGKILIGDVTAKVAKFNSSGTPDTSFGTAGIADVTAAFPVYFSLITIKEAGSNRLVMAGTAYDTSSNDGYTKLIALQHNGALDTSFGNMGTINQLDISRLEGVDKCIAVRADGKILLTGYTEPANTTYADAILTRLKASPTTTGRLYTFTGSGLWSNSANWADGTVPPTTIPSGSSIVIDPPAGSECVIDITVHVQTGASVTVKAGKSVRLPGNLMVQ